MILKYIILILIIAFYLFSLRANYKLDMGEHRAAKIINPILVCGLFVFHFINVYYKIQWLIHYKYDAVSILYTSNVIPAFLNLLTWILDLIVSIWIVILTWSMIFGVTKSRLRFIYTIPLICLLDIPQLIQSMKEQFENPGYWVFIAIATIVLFWIGIAVLLSRKFMIDFYNRQISINKK
jgi:hypothetical protein